MKFAALLVAGAAAMAPIQMAPEHGIANHWIVLFESGNFAAYKEAQMLAKSTPDMVINRTYNINNGAYLGVAGMIESETSLHAMASLPGVRLVEQDALAFAIRGDEEMADRPISQTGHWGLDRADGAFDQNYSHPDDAGRGATVYILDTGLRLSHNDFGGRASFGNNFSTSPDGDRQGHGTHCGCTATGASHGLASFADVVDVKVLGDSGSGAWSGVIAGIDWADNACTGNVCVQSLSLGGGINTAVDEAVNAAAGSKSAMILASGNSNGDACSFSPARAQDGFSVNAGQRSGDNIQRSSFSNFGTCTQIYSAGSSVLSCGVSSDTATATMSGTSMACPHVAGHAAVCISAGSGSVSAVYNCLTENAVGTVSGNPSGPDAYASYRN